VLYLTFDDGPHPQVTAFVLDQLKQYNARATFFCIGKNVEANFDIYKKILQDGHKPGNHTYSHLNGWKVPDNTYLNDIYAAKKIIDSPFFRPPYGRITKFQLAQLQGIKYNLTPVMWTVLSGDFDKKISNEKCLANVLKNSRPGSIVVFHDSEKSFEKLQHVLPKVLEHFHAKGYSFKAL
jgi:peptidoglycan/xylan/chitin deacetylase (PgdA/CDA1 family)